MFRLKCESTRNSKSKPECLSPEHCSRMPSTQMEMVSRGVDGEKICFSIRSRNLVIWSRTQTSKDDILNSTGSEPDLQKALRNSLQDSTMLAKKDMVCRWTKVTVALSIFPLLREATKMASRCCKNKSVAWEDLPSLHRSCTALLATRGPPWKDFWVLNSLAKTWMRCWVRASKSTATWSTLALPALAWQKPEASRTKSTARTNSRWAM